MIPACRPQRLVGDTAYGVAPMLNWMVEEKHIASHVPVSDHTGRKADMLSAAEFCASKASGLSREQLERNRSAKVPR